MQESVQRGSWRVCGARHLHAGNFARVMVCVVGWHTNTVGTAPASVAPAVLACGPQSLAARLASVCGDGWARVDVPYSGGLGGCFWSPRLPTAALGVLIPHPRVWHQAPNPRKHVTRSTALPEMVMLAPLSQPHGSLGARLQRCFCGTQVEHRQERKSLLQFIIGWNGWKMGTGFFFNFCAWQWCMLRRHKFGAH